MVYSVVYGKCSSFFFPAKLKRTLLVKISFTLEVLYWRSSVTAFIHCYPLLSNSVLRWIYPNILLGSGTKKYFSNYPYSFSIHPFCFFFNFISLISTSTVVDGHCYSSKSINRGVPEGYVLSLPLVLPFINGLLSCTSSSVKSLASRIHLVNNPSA